MNDIKISVIMPVLNGMPYFGKALNSVLNQSLKEIEILVVDSGSTDETRAYILEVMKKDIRIKLLDTEKKSMGYQYNLGIQNAKGRYVCFCESDDYINEKACEKLYEAARQGGWPEAVKSDFYMFFTKRGKEFPFYYAILPEGHKSLYGKIINLQKAPLLFGRDVNMWNGIYKRTFLAEKQIVLNETKGAAFQDIDFVLQVNITAERMLYIQDAFYHYRRDNENSSVYKTETYQFIIWELLYMLDWLERDERYILHYGAKVLQKLFVFFAMVYGTYLYYNGVKERDEQIEILQRRLERLYWQQSFTIYAEVEDFELFRLFIKSPNLFKELSKANALERINNSVRFRRYLEGKKHITIFGSGEYGRNLLAFLLINDFDGDICFCDNDQNKQSTEISGCRVWSVNEAYKKFPDTCFLLPSKRLYMEMKAQLLKMGVKPGQIMPAPEMGLHAATELRCKAK